MKRKKYIGIMTICVIIMAVLVVAYIGKNPFLRSSRAGCNRMRSNCARCGILLTIVGGCPYNC